MSIPFSSYQGLESHESLTNATRPTATSSKDLSNNEFSRSQNANSDIRGRSNHFGSEEVQFVQSEFGLSSPAPHCETSHSRNLTSTTTGSNSPGPAIFTHSREASDRTLLNDKSNGLWPISRSDTPLSYNQSLGASSNNASQVDLHRIDSGRQIISQGTKLSLRCYELFIDQILNVSARITSSA